MKRGNSYYRARIAAINALLDSDLPQNQRRWLQNGYDRFAGDRIKELVEREAAGDAPLTFAELATYSTWFELHPEKVAGELTSGTSIYFPVIVKGTKADCERMFAAALAAEHDAEDEDLELLELESKALEMELQLTLGAIDDDLLAMKGRIAEWLSPETLSEAIGKTRDEIFEMYGNECLPIAYVPKYFANKIDAELTDFYVYCGKGYFIDHAVNHHSSIPSEKYLLIQDVLNDPDEIKKTTTDGHDSYIFIKKLGRFNAVVLALEVSENGKMILHKSFFDQKKKPYANVGIRLYKASSEAGDLPHLQGCSSIIRAKMAHGRILPTLGDASRINDKIPNRQNKTHTKRENNLSAAATGNKKTRNNTLNNRRL